MAERHGNFFLFEEGPACDYCGWAEPNNSFLDQGSVSQGTVAGGCIARSRALPFRGDNHMVLENLAKRKIVYGVDELLSLIQAAAAQVAQQAENSVFNRRARLGSTLDDSDKSVVEFHVQCAPLLVTPI